MSEMNETFNMEQATTETLNTDINFDANGIEMIGGAVAGAGITAVVAFKLGYAAGVKDAAHALKMEAKALLDKIKSMKGAVKKGITLFGYKLQSPFKKVEGSKEPQAKNVAGEGSKDSGTDK